MTEQKKKKLIPIGIDDFERLVEGNYYFADKSLLIKELLDSGAAVTLLPRPRRFGKTLNLSMLRYFFEKVVDRSYTSIHFPAENTQYERGSLQGERENSIFNTNTQGQENNKSARPEERETRLEACPEPVEWGFVRAENSRRHLFDGLKIEQHADCMKHQGKYPVIWLTFKDVKSKNWAECYRLLQMQISAEFERNNYLVEYLSSAERERFERITRGTGDLADFMRSLLDLSTYLERAYKVKVIVLIDEYDTPIHEGYSNGYYDEIINFMRSFMGAGLKGNNALQWGVLTGILRIAKESIFSDMNNLEVCTLVRQDYSDKFGFLEDEVEAMLRSFELDNHIETVRNWYDGYQSGDYKIYNPWSIVNFVKNKGRFQAYWVNTSSNTMIKDLLKRCTPEMKEELEVIITGGKVTKVIRENIIMSEIEQSDDALWNFLLFCGYLTFENYRLVTDINYAELSIPNVEVGTTYKTTFSTWFSEGSGLRNYNKMLASLIVGDPAQFKKNFEQFSHESLSYFDTKGTEPERFYHALVLGMLASLMETHLVRSNRESGYGRYDVMFIPKDRSKPGIVLEFKAVDLDKKETLEIAAQKALKQVEDNKYEAELRALGLNTILKLGISFLGKESFVLVG